MKVKELVEARQKAAADVKDLANRQDKWTAEDKANWVKVNERYNEARDAEKAELDRLSEKEEVDARLKEIEGSDREERGGRRIGLDHDERKNADPERRVARVERDKQMALGAWMYRSLGGELSREQREACKRVGLNPQRKFVDIRLSTRYDKPAWSRGGAQETRAGLNVATSGAGKETIPQGFVNELEAKLLQFGGPRNVCTVHPTSTGNSLPWPTVDDTGNTGALLSEATTIGTSVDPTFAAVTFGAFKYSSKAVLVSSEIDTDSAFNMPIIVGGLLGTRLGRIQGTHSTTGDGSSKPNGIVPVAGTGVTAAGVASITSDELFGLFHSVDPAYRALPSFGWMFHDNVLLYLRKLKDANGAYLWQQGMAAGAPDKLMGAPVTINQHMSSAITTGLSTVLVGAFEKFIIREVSTIRMYHMTERYRDVDQDGFVAFQRWDSNTIQAAALKKLVQA